MTMRKECVTIAAHREAYIPSDCPSDCIERAMTVGEFKRLLENFNEDAPALVSNDDGYTYGAVTEFCLDNGDYDS